MTRVINHNRDESEIGNIKERISFSVNDFQEERILKD